MFSASGPAAWPDVAMRLATSPSRHAPSFRGPPRALVSRPARAENSRPESTPQFPA